MFETQLASAFDTERSIEIHYPRILPGEGENEMELQFPIYQASRLIYGIGCFGSITDLADGSVFWNYGLDRQAQIELLLSAKPWIAPDLTDRAFIDYISDGLTAVFGGGQGIKRTTIYSFYLSAEAYVFLGGKRDCDEPSKTVELARRVVKAHSDGM